MKICRPSGHSEEQIALRQISVPVCPHFTFLHARALLVFSRAEILADSKVTRKEEERIRIGNADEVGEQSAESEWQLIRVPAGVAGVISTGPF